LPMTPKGTTKLNCSIFSSWHRSSGGVAPHGRLALAQRNYPRKGL
jgi:hypothetical protein